MCLKGNVSGDLSIVDVIIRTEQNSIPCNVRVLFAEFSLSHFHNYTVWYLQFRDFQNLIKFRRSECTLMSYTNVHVLNETPQNDFN